MALRKSLPPRVKRTGDGTLRNDVKIAPKTDKYYKGYDKLFGKPKCKRCGVEMEFNGTCDECKKELFKD